MVRAPPLLSAGPWYERGRRWPSPGAPPSAPETQARDDRSVPFDVLPPQIVQQPAALADQHEEPTPGVMVLGVGLQVVGEIRDALAEQRDLYLGRAGVGLPAARVADQRRLLVGEKGLTIRSRVPEGAVDPGLSRPPGRGGRRPRSGPGGASPGRSPSASP